MRAMNAHELLPKRSENEIPRGRTWPTLFPRCIIYYFSSYLGKAEKYRFVQISNAIFSKTKFFPLEILNVYMHEKYSFFQ